MADAYVNMLDLAKKTGSDTVVGLVEQNLAIYPEARLFPSRTIAGTSFKALLRTDYPDPGFRLVNEGTETLKSSYENRMAECFFLDGQMQVDEAEDGADNGDVARLMDLEAQGMMKGVMRRIGKQVWYGTGLEDVKGFPGAVQVVDSTLVVDAAGTTASTGSSVYLVIFGNQNVQLLFGKNRILSMPEWTRQRITTSSKHFFAWVTNISGWVGTQWINTYSLGRIKKLTADSGKGLTDTLVADLIGKFPNDTDFSNAGLFMSRRSARQLQQSRTATAVYNFGSRTASGNDIQAPWPTDSNGIPIYLTSGLRDTEELTL
jgi:hypothetical protein